MNNALLTIDEPEVINKEPSLREEESKVVRIIEALNRVAQSSDWLTLKELIFDEVVDNLDKQISSEAKKDQINTTTLHRLQGQLVWAKKYADLESLTNFYRTRLIGIRKQYE